MDGKMYVSVRTASGAPLKRAIDEDIKLIDALNDLLAMEGLQWYQSTMLGYVVTWHNITWQNIT